MLEIAINAMAFDFPRQRIDGEAAAPPGPCRLVLPDFFGEMNQRHIELMLHKGG